MSTQLYTGQVKPKLTGGNVQSYIANYKIKFDFPFDSKPSIIDFNVKTTQGTILLKEALDLNEEEVLLNFKSNNSDYIQFEIVVDESIKKLSQRSSNFLIVDPRKHNDLKLIESFKSEFVFHKNIQVEYNLGGNMVKGRVVCFIYPPYTEYNVDNKIKAYVYGENTLSGNRKFYSSHYYIEDFNIISSSNVEEKNYNPFQYFYSNNKRYNQLYWVYNIDTLNLQGKIGAKEIYVNNLIIPASISFDQKDIIDSIHIIGTEINNPGKKQIYHYGAIIWAV